MLPTRNTDLLFATVVLGIVLVATAEGWSHESLAVLMAALDVIHAFIKGGGDR